MASTDPSFDQHIITDDMMAEWGMNGQSTTDAPNNGSNSNSPAIQRFPSQESTIPIQSQPILQTYIPVESSEESMTIYDQSGSVILGPGSHKEAIILGLGLSRISHRHHDDLSKAKKYAMEQSIKHVLMKQTISHQQQQQKVAMYAQALSLMARVYIGSISFELKEDTMKSAFSVFGPIKSVNMSWDPVTGHHKGFAFLEYEVPEAAQLAQDHMNGILLGGRNIKVGRSGNLAQAQPIIDMIIQDAKKYNRVYVASIHQDLTEVDVKSVFEAFGTIVSIEMAKGVAPGKHNGYCFIEYETEQAAIEAVASMNMFDLGGQHLRVGRAITPPQAKEYIAPPANSTLPTAAAVAAAAVTAKIQAMEPSMGMTTQPQIIVSNTPPTAQSTSSGLGPQIFTVPPPGVAIPQSTPPAPSLVTPQLYSIPHGSSMPNLSTGSPSTLQGGNSPASVMTNQLQPTTTQIVFTPKFSQQPPIGSSVPPPKIIQPPPPVSLPKVTSTSNTSSPVTATTSSSNMGQQLNAAQAAAAQATQRLATAPLIPNSGQLNEKQKQMLDNLEGAQTLAAQEDLKIKGNEARNILMHKLMRRTESCVLVLKNMVSPEEVDDTLQDEVAEECGKFGQVDQVVIYQEKRSEYDSTPAVVKIFVKYSMAQEADTAKNALDGRYFSGRQIKAQIYDENLFDHHDLSG